MWLTNIHPETLPVIVALRKEDTFKHCANSRLWMIFQTITLMIFKHWRAISYEVAVVNGGGQCVIHSLVDKPVLGTP